LDGSVVWHLDNKKQTSIVSTEVQEHSWCLLSTPARHRELSSTCCWCQEWETGSECDMAHTSVYADECTWTRICKQSPVCAPSSVLCTIVPPVSNQGHRNFWREPLNSFSNLYENITRYFAFWFRANSHLKAETQSINICWFHSIKF
jgi:hypothetical protein